MLVAVEGVDLTGKTTLVKELEEGLPVLVRENSPSPAHSLVAFEDATMWNYDPLAEHTLVLERSHIGASVWPEIFRHPSDLIDPAIRRHIEMFMCSRGLVTIYTTRNYHDLHEALFVDDGPRLRPAALALALKRFEQALAYSHSRGYVFEHDHVKHHLGPQDVAFVGGQADDDVRPFYGITHRWIGNPNPTWVVAMTGYSDREIAGRAGDNLHPTIAHLLRSIPERAWRGVALVEIEGMSDEGLREFGELADAEAWIAVGDETRERVLDIVQPTRCWTPGYAIAEPNDLAAAWDLWSGE